MKLNVTPLGRPRRRSFRSNLRSRFSCDLNPWPSARPDEGAPKGRAVGAPPSKALRRVRGRRGSSRPRPFPAQEKNREVQAPTEFPSKVVEMSPSRKDPRVPGVSSQVFFGVGAVPSRGPGAALVCVGMRKEIHDFAAACHLVLGTPTPKLAVPASSVSGGLGTAHLRGRTERSSAPDSSSHVCKAGAGSHHRA